MNDLAQFIREHHEWPRNPEWLGWHLSNGFVMRALGDDGTIAGVAIVRPVMKPEDAQDCYEFDPEGSVLFIDLIICKAPLAMQALGFAVLKRFGMRETVAWKRPPFYVTEVHSAARLRRHLFGKVLAYGRRE